MIVLSLFDGMSCGQIALDQLGIKPTKYYASEVDKYAIAVTQHNYPNTIQLGDVTKWREWDIDWSEIDLIYGGSPCQGFSFAGKQLAFDDPRSALFFVFVDILNHIRKVNPDVKFLLENVRMKKEYLDVISEYMEVQPVMINSALVSAQNRVRYYWTNIAKIEQPEDMGILLRDVLEDIEISEEIKEEWNPKESKNYIQWDVNNKGNKSQDQRAFYSDGKHGTLPANGGESKVKVTNRCIQVGKADLKGHDQIKRVYSPDGKSPTVTTCEGGHREPKVIVDRDKSHCLDANYAKGSNWEQYKKKSRRQLVGSEHSWRKLTPKECERLQTVPDDYTLVPHPTFKNRMMSNSQRYKMLGNGWTVEVIKHIFKNLIN